MNYLEFLYKKAEANKIAQNEQTTDTSKAKTDEDSEAFSLFGNQFTTTQKEDGTSVFNLATKEQLQNIDYEKLVSKEEKNEEQVEENSENNTLTSVLRDFFSFDAVKQEADINGDGEISAQEAKSYVEKLAAKDGDASTLSMDDFDAVIQEKGIDLQTTADAIAAQTGEAVQTTDEQSSVEQAVTQDVSAPASSSYSENYSPETIASGGSGSYSGAGSTSPANPLDSMSLEQLESEKTTREATVKEKQAAVNAVNNGTNEKVSAAKTQMQEAEKAYKEAVKNDPNVKKSTDKDFEKNLEKINENQTKLDENAVKITDKEAEIATQEESLKTLNSEVESLTSYYDKFNAQLTKLQDSLSKAGTPTGKEEDREKDAQIKAKRQEINAKITEKNNEISQKKKEIDTKNKEIKNANKKLENLKKDLEKSNEEKTKLEEKKTKLNEEKAAIEATIKETCTAETKAKMDAYNKAVKNVETVKATELQAAQTSLKEAQASVQEVNTRINQIKNRKVSVTDLNMDSIPAEYRDKVSVKTLPNGTEVLTFNYTNYKDLKPEMQDKIAVFNEVAAEKGYTFVMSDGFRSIEESNRARARKGNLVAPGGQSPHNYGSAFDCGVYKNGGQGLSRQEWTEFTREVQRRSGNITWGGDFKSKSCEVWHFELSDWRKYKTA